MIRLLDIFDELDKHYQQAQNNYNSSVRAMTISSVIFAIIFVVIIISGIVAFIRYNKRHKSISPSKLNEIFEEPEQKEEGPEFCEYCGAMLEKTDKVCPRCGANIKR